jgi:hypothetical protein
MKRPSHPHPSRLLKKMRDTAILGAGYLMQQERERFSHARTRAMQLRAAVPDGHLTKDQLAKLLVKDNSGRLWRAGLDGQSWYRWDGDDWIPGTPASLLPSRDDDIGLYIFFMLPILIFIAWVLYRLFGG